MDLTPPERFGAVVLHVVSSPSNVGALDQGRVHVRGPTSKDLSATPGAQVTIDQLPAGDYTVALEGLVANEVVNFVQITAHVEAGRTTNATVSSFPSFVPAITSLPSAGASKAFTVSFSGVAGAQSYEVEAATDAGFASNHVTQPTAQSPVTVTVPTYDSYFVRVRALDAYQGRGQPSPAQSIHLTAPAADLVISAPATLSVTPTNPTQGASVTLAPFTVTNVGNTASNPGVIGFYLSGDATITTADALLDTLSLADLPPNASTNFPARQLTVPAGTTPGTYYLGVLVDETNQTSEADETNNSKSTALIVKIIFEVDSIAPAANATAVETGAVVVAHFSDGVDPSTLTDSSFKVSVGETALATKVSYDPSTRVAQLSVPLLPASTYQTTVATTVQDTAGRPLASAHQTTFSTRAWQSVTVGPGGGQPSMVLGVGGGGNHVIYENSGNVVYSTCPVTCTSVGGWQSVTILLFGTEAALARDNAGGLHVSYRDTTAKVLRYASCVSLCMTAANWTTTLADGSGDVDFDGSAITVEIGGPVHVAYRDRLSGNLRYAECLNGCTIPNRWNATAVGTQAYYPSIAVDQSGRVHIVSYDGVTGHLMYTACSGTCYQPGNWQTIEVDPTLGDFGIGTSIAVDIGGRLHVAYYDINSRLKYATCSNTCSTVSNWQIGTVDFEQFGDMGWNPSLAVDASGRLYVSYYDALRSQLKFATCAVACIATGSWRNVPVDTGGHSSSLVVDPSGRVHVSYRDVGSGLKYIE